MEDIDLETYKKYKKYFLKTKPKEYYADVYFYNGMHFYIKDKSITELINDEYQREIVCFIRDFQNPTIFKGINSEHQIINALISYIVTKELSYSYTKYDLSTDNFKHGGIPESVIYFASLEELDRHVSEYKLIEISGDMKLSLKFDLQPIKSFTYISNSKTILNHFYSESERNRIKFNNFYSLHKKWFDYYNNLNDEDRLKLELTGKI